MLMQIKIECVSVGINVVDFPGVWGLRPGDRSERKTTERSLQWSWVGIINYGAKACKPLSYATSFFNSGIP